MCLVFAALQRGPTGAAAPPSLVVCARLALEWLLVPTLAAGLCHPAAVCCSSLPSAAFSVARVEAVRAPRLRAGGGGARPRADVRRGAAPPRGATQGVAPTAAEVGGGAGRRAGDEDGGGEKRGTQGYGTSDDDTSKQDIC